MSLQDSPEGLKRLWICAAMVLSLGILIGFWGWPIVEDYRWDGCANSIREGMPVDQVLAGLGRADQSFELRQSDGEWECHYQWASPGMNLEIVVRNQQVVSVARSFRSAS